MYIHVYIIDVFILRVLHTHSRKKNRFNAQATHDHRHDHSLTADSCCKPHRGLTLPIYGPAQGDLDLGVDGLISGAVVRFLKGDVSGTSAAVGALMAQYPMDRRVLLTVVSLAALAGDAGLVQEASRALQVSYRRRSFACVIFALLRFALRCFALL